MCCVCRLEEEREPVKAGREGQEPEGGVGDQIPRQKGGGGIVVLLLCRSVGGGDLQAYVVIHCVHVGKQIPHQKGSWL